MSVDSYPFYSVSGSPRELGRSHGEQAAERIRSHLDYLASTLEISRAQLQQRALQFEPLFTKHCPHLLPEIEGLAEGAGIERADALAVQIRGELGPVADEACTTFVIGRNGTASGEILIGQTSDTPPVIERLGYVLRLTPDDDRPAMLMWTFGGMIGYHGLNRHGISHFANSFGGGPDWKFALPHYPLKRMMLESASVGQIIGRMNEVPVCSNGNYVLCDGEGKILDVELTSEGPFPIEDDGAGFLAHSNHYLCGPHACQENFDQSLPDSFPRLERMQTMIREKYGSIIVDDVKGFLSDHSGHPVSICRHPHDGYGDSILPPDGKTVSAIIAEPASGRLHVALGNPCEKPFVEYTLDD